MSSCIRLVFILFILIQSVLSYDNLDLKCLESTTHKVKPTSESSLTGECQNWKSLSCCHPNTTEEFHLETENWQGFNYNHCGQMSDSCKRFFKKELCLYECDPYLGNWMVKDQSKKMRNERYYELPLCRKDCNEWFNACKYDYTCRDNWNRGFKWINRTNYCNDHEKCDTIQNKFKTAENFCSKIWDDSFKVTDENCISFQFDDSKSNPNKKIAEYYQSNGIGTNRIHYEYLIFALLTVNIFSQ